MNTNAAGSYHTGEYRNLFLENGISEEAIRQRLEDTWNELFYGAPEVRIYHPMDDDKGYMVDTGNTDVRTEGMSYGMMMAVQLDKKRSSTGSGNSPKYSCSIQRDGIRTISPGTASWTAPGCRKARPRTGRSSSRWHCSLPLAAGGWCGAVQLFRAGQDYSSCLCAQGRGRRRRRSDVGPGDPADQVHPGNPVQ